MRFNLHFGLITVPFTGAVFYSGTYQTFLVCSDTKDKGKNTVYVFLIHLFKIMLQSTGAADNTKDVIFTDGPSSEFKNRYCMKLLRSISEKHKRQVSWKYFATSHGKGVINGISGKAKSLVHEKVMIKMMAPQSMTQSVLLKLQRN